MKLPIQIKPDAPKLPVELVWEVSEELKDCMDILAEKRIERKLKLI